MILGKESHFFKDLADRKEALVALCLQSLVPTLAQFWLWPLCPLPSHPKAVALHLLDVVWVVRVYLSAMASFQWSDSLFVIADGPLKGLEASSATISQWIRRTVARAYAIKGQASPFSITGHSPHGE